MEKKKLKFPDGFLWGAATSAHQVEGNLNNDWTKWEKDNKGIEKSGRACDYWNRFEDDHKLLQELGVKIFRLSVEWSRIEPEENVFSEEALNHYRKIFADLKRRNIKIQLTLWHWTSPIWFSEKYGFHNKTAVEIFIRYVERVVRELGEFIDYYIVFNEIMVPLGQGYLAGLYPPGLKNPCKFWRAMSHMAAAHRETYGKIHEIFPEAQVGSIHLYNQYESEGLGFLLRIVDRIARWYRVDFFGKKIKGFQDYIGIDYYRLGKIRFDWKKVEMNSREQDYFGFTIEEDEKNVMKWITYPEGMYKILKEAGEKFKLPIYITENGMPTSGGLEDNDRIEFIRAHLKFVHKAMEEGVNVMGYNYWSLLDNFEWLYGYEPKFGLVEVNFETLERKPRKSFYEYAKICESNEV